MVALEGQPQGLWINEQLFRFYARQLVRRWQSARRDLRLGHRAVGLPPFDLPVARGSTVWISSRIRTSKAEYIANSDLALCTSRVLVDRLKRFGKQGVYIPTA